MKSYSKENYLAEIKNRMLFRCSLGEISTTLEDLNSYFEAGTAEGKTEETLCRELEAPEKVVQDLLKKRNERKNSPPFPAVYLICGGILCGMFLLDICYPRLLSSCLAVLLVPVFLWYIFGGRGLLQIRSDSFRNHSGFLVFEGISILYLLLQQGLTVLVRQGTYPPVFLTKVVYGLGYGMAVLTFFVLLVIAYKLCQGYYLSCGLLFPAVGAICSYLLGNYWFLNLGTPSISSFSFGFLPFVVGILLGVLCDFGIFKIKEKKAWILR